MKITLKNYQRNWLARYDQTIAGFILSIYRSDAAKRQTGESLYTWIKRVTGQEMKLPAENDQEDANYVSLMALIDSLPTNIKAVEKTEAAKAVLKNRLKKLIEDSQAQQVLIDEEKETEDQRAPLLGDKKDPGPYIRGLAYFKKKRELAKQNGLRWLLKAQLQQLKKLKKAAWLGWFWTIAYAASVGLGLAGYMVMVIGISVIQQSYWGLLVAPLFMGWFSTQANYWVARREPSELFFDFLSSREDTQDLPRYKRVMAWIMGLTSASLLTAISAYGMWEFFKLVGILGSPWGMGVAISSITVLSAFFFVPELSLSLKFDREWLRVNPLKRVENLYNYVNGDKRYIAGFFALFSCVIVGSVFAALAMAEIASAFMPFGVAAGVLSVLALSGFAFYLDKADTTMKKLFDYNQNKGDNPFGSHTKYVTATQFINACANFVPAFLGGLAMGGPVLGIYTGLCGFMTSFLSLAEGKTEGHDETIKQEIAETENTLAQFDSNSIGVVMEPRLEVKKGQFWEATKCPFLFSPFYTTKETQEVEMDLLEARVPTFRSRTD